MLLAMSDENLLNDGSMLFLSSITHPKTGSGALDDRSLHMDYERRISNNA